MSAFTLQDLINQAREETKWLWCHYQDLWFSPDQLEEENRKGSFRWGPINWKLRDPSERVSEAKRRADRAAEELARVSREVGQ